uniref:Uncharacterized protein n=1 Tax=Arundo donax TaxID=35708 RepID=A0A0A9BME5_ARUDO
MEQIKMIYKPALLLSLHGLG